MNYLLILVAFIFVISVNILIFYNRTNVVVGITTIPSRIGKCDKVVKSIIHEQSTPPDKLIVTIPHKYTRFPNETVNIPLFMLEESRLQILRSEKDYGPATKFMGPIIHADLSADTVVVITDDDGIKKREWLSTLVRTVNENPNSIVTLSTRSGGEVHGGRGFAFRRGIFDAEDLMVAMESKHECRLVDDDFLTHYCRTHDIPIIGMERKDLWVPETKDFENKLRDLDGDNKRALLREKCAASFGQPVI